jgi:CheY-like chemotaxis protein
MAHKGKTVLIVDDSEEVRILSRAILEKLSLRVLEAASALQAIDLITQQRPDIVILDLDMPQLSGFDFLSIRKSLPQISDIPVIVSSALKDIASIHKAINLGATDYLLKPMRSDLLLHRLKKIFLNPDFRRYKFPETQTPFLSLKPVDASDVVNGPDRPTLGVKLFEMDEIGMTVLSRALVNFGSEFTVSGESLKTLTGQKNFLATCISVSLNPALESYTVYLEFDPKDETIGRHVKHWIEQKQKP